MNQIERLIRRNDIQSVYGTGKLLRPKRYWAPDESSVVEAQIRNFLCNNGI